AGVQAVPRGFLPVQRNIEVWLTQDPEDTEVAHPPDLVHYGQDLRGNLFQRREIAANDLDRIGTLNARQTFFDIVLDVLREVEGDARELVRELLLQLFYQPLFRHTSGPLVRRLERREELGIEETCRIAAIVRTAMLRDDGDDFRAAAKNLADTVDHRHARFERDRRRHRSANPEIAFFEARQELAA